jgi:hypothetical protein
LSNLGVFFNTKAIERTRRDISRMDAAAIDRCAAILPC